MPRDGGRKTATISCPPTGQRPDISDGRVRIADRGGGSGQLLDGRSRFPLRHGPCKRTSAMSLASLSTELLRQLDLLIVAVSDDDVLRQGLQRERVRLASHLHSTVDPWLCSLSTVTCPPPAPGPVESRWNRAVSRSLVAGLRQRRFRRGSYARLRGLSYQALDAELIDARIFDRLQLLGRRALQAHTKAGPRTYASSSSPSDGGGSMGADSGVGRSGPPIGGGADGPPSPLPSRTNRSRVSTSLAWA